MKIETMDKISKAVLLIGSVLTVLALTYMVLNYA